MAVLPDADRVRIWRGLMRWWSSLANQAALPNVLKADLRAAVDATDSWIDTNQAAYVAALPVTFRTNSTTAQKTLLFCCVAAMRVSLAALRMLIGEVD